MINRSKQKSLGSNLPLLEELRTIVLFDQLVEADHTIVTKIGAALRECSCLLEIDRTTGVLWVRNGSEQKESPKCLPDPFTPKHKESPTIAQTKESRLLARNGSRWSISSCEVKSAEPILPNFNRFPLVLVTWQQFSPDFDQVESEF